MTPLELIAALVLGGAGGYGLRTLQKRRTPSPLAALQAQVVDLSLRYESTANQSNLLQTELVDALKRLRVTVDQVSALDDRQSELDERLTRVVSDTLQLGNEVKGQIEGLEERLEAMGQQQESVLQALDGQLQEMQSFIVKAAEEAAKQRAALPQPSVVTPVMAQSAVRQQPAVDDAELQQLLSRQQVLQQQFAQRRRAEGEAAFRAPNGVGL